MNCPCCNLSQLSFLHSHSSPLLHSSVLRFRPFFLAFLLYYPHFSYILKFFFYQIILISIQMCYNICHLKKIQQNKLSLTPWSSNLLLLTAARYSIMWIPVLYLFITSMIACSFRLLQRCCNSNKYLCTCLLWFCDDFLGVLSSTLSGTSYHKWWDFCIPTSSPMLDIIQVSIF